MSAGERRRTQFVFWWIKFPPHFVDDPTYKKVACEKPIYAATKSLIIVQLRCQEKMNLQTIADESLSERRANVEK